MSSKTINGIKFEKSNRLHKKYKATFKDGSVIHFGDKRYQHYYDKIGFYSKLNHKDPERRRRYRARHSGIDNKDGSKSISHKKSAAYLSYYYLW